MKESLKRYLPHLRELASLIKKTLFESKKEAKKPRIINMMANDICNSKCTMCNIWKQNLEFQLSPDQLEHILTDPLYSEVTSVGITGGEPTLRDDLADYYEACCKALPKLTGMSIITNAYKDGTVIKRIEEVKERLQEYDVNFSLMVSLDGVGKIHDQNRGREGNFDSAMKVIDHFKENTDIPVTIGCTITKENVWHIDEMLDFLIEKGLYGRFRVAEFINRLYNNDLTRIIRNFNEDEIFHLWCFFKRLEFEYEKTLLFNRTYKSIQNILSGGQRLIGCPYQSEGVVLDSKGQLQYCAPKSKEIGDTLSSSSLEIFKDNLAERRRIKAEDCSNCIHDYHARPTWKEYRGYFDELRYRLIFKPVFSRVFLATLTKASRYNVYTVFITGWYGTETTGDKAILAGIVNQYKEKYKSKVQFTISSIFPFYTQRTLKELNLTAKVVPVYGNDFFREIIRSDEVVMGGGPLMHIGAMSIPLMAFKAAKKFKKRTVIYGCGIGPLESEKYIKMTRQLLLLSDEILLRDSKSVEKALELVPKCTPSMIGDPAIFCIESIRKNLHGNGRKNKVLACYLREWEPNYKGELSESEFSDQRDSFESGLAESIKKFCIENEVVPHFFSMHTFAAGGDDRVFYRRFTKEYFEGFEHYIENFPSNVGQITNSMLKSSYNLCMRFHSVVFAHVLDTNYLAIDYTNKGKIHGFLSDSNALHRKIDLETIARNPQFQFDFSLGQPYQEPQPK